MDGWLVVGKVILKNHTKTNKLEAYTIGIPKAKKNPSYANASSILISNYYCFRVSIVVHTNG